MFGKPIQALNFHVNVVFVALGCLEFSPEGPKGPPKEAKEAKDAKAAKEVRDLALKDEADEASAPKNPKGGRPRVADPYRDVLVASSLNQLPRFAGPPL